MPNWCSNRLTISGPPQDLADFMARVQARDEDGDLIPLSFETVFPIPEWLCELASPRPSGVTGIRPISADSKPDPAWGPNQGTIEFGKLLWDPIDWFTWCNSHWGTKWDLDTDTRLTGSSESGTICYEFDSAWSPPNPWIFGASVRWPTLCFDTLYAESGVNFAGRMKVKAGFFLVDESWSDHEAMLQLRSLDWEAWHYFAPDEDE